MKGENQNDYCPSTSVDLQQTYLAARAHLDKELQADNKVHPEIYLSHWRLNHSPPLKYQRLHLGQQPILFSFRHDIKFIFSLHALFIFFKLFEIRGKSTPVLSVIFSPYIHQASHGYR
uniref:Uncharacterized protein n=1 Tax=Opuntia streptacantha TaxID=393608 RepID=A0A7C9DTN9_OPUST